MEAVSKIWHSLINFITFNLTNDRYKGTGAGTNELNRF